MTHRQAEEGVALLGVRHHGPGSARAVAAALEQYRPDAVLIEGPAEADALLGFAADRDMVPPRLTAGQRCSASRQLR
jgi:pheromone shutdown protein TraB